MLPPLSALGSHIATHSSTSQAAHLCVYTLTLSLQPELLSGGSTRLTLTALLDRKVN